MLLVKAFRLLAVLGMLVLAIGITNDARAAQEGTPPAVSRDVLAFEIYPKGQELGTFFAPTIDAGETATLTVVLACTGNVPFEGRTYAVNASSAINGGLAVAELGTPQEGVTTWLDYSEEVYTIQPGTAIERTFTVTVPEGTPPGQYLTAIALENAEARAVEGSENFQQIIRFPVPVFITVPGPIEPEFEIGDISLTVEPNASLIDIRIINTGNIRVRPEGTISISDAAGQQIFNAAVTMSSVYAHDETSLLINIPQPLTAGDYHVAVDMNDPETKTNAASETTVTATAPATPAPPPPVQILEALATPRPSADEVQFLDVATTIENFGAALTNVQVVLHVTRNGELVEDFPLASSMALAEGRTPVQSRYIPATGWSAGTWQFSLTVQIVDAGTGVAQVLTTADLGQIEIP